MGSKLIKKYFDYSLLENKRNVVAHLLEDEIDDMSGDIGSKREKSEKKTDPKKTSSSVDYKINSKLNVGKSTDLSYSSYVTLFVEALNSLDAMASLANSVDCSSVKSFSFTTS